MHYGTDSHEQLSILYLQGENAWYGGNLHMIATPPTKDKLRLDVYL